MKIKQILLVFTKKITAVLKARQLAAAAIVAVLSAVAVAAVLTPSSGVLSALVFARASFADPTSIQFTVRKYYGPFFRPGFREQVINVDNARDTVIGQIVMAPGGQSGWHSHPGPAVVLIKSGQLSLYDGDDPTCTARIYTAGQSFVESGHGDVGLFRNESQSENLELWATYFDVPPGGSPRIDAPNPGCSFLP